MQNLQRNIGFSKLFIYLFLINTKNQNFYKYRDKNQNIFANIRQEFYREFQKIENINSR